VALRELATIVLAIRGAHPVRVAVDGVDAAGKTALADELAAQIEESGRTTIRASIDGFHRRRSDRYRRGRDSAEGYYRDSFDHETLRRVLLDPLGAGGDRWYRTAVFDFRRDSAVQADAVLAPPDAVLVFDGVFLQRPELVGRWDLCIFVDVDPHEALRRGTARDADLFGSTEEARARYLGRYVPGQEIYLREARPRERADVIFENTAPASPRVHLSKAASGTADG
jgi:uridine kinase